MQSKPNASTTTARKTTLRRMRTEQDRKGSFAEEASAFLPKVRWEERSAQSNKKKAADICDLDRLSLQ